MLTGLVVGKFCPLHKGHEALIEFARQRCDRLVILSYTNPEFPDCPPARRAAWLEALFPEAIRLVLAANAYALPENDAPEAEHRTFVATVCREMLGLVPDRVFTSESYGNGFAQSLARDFGHPVEHLMCDPHRSAVPISGTALRRDPTLHRAFLSEPVRRSMVRRVALVGGESTGKTTLAAALASSLSTCWVPEYGRELWDRRAGELRYEDMLAIAQEQVAREERALTDANGWLICDTTPLVTAFYSEAMFGRVNPALRALASRHYDHLFLCAPDFPFVQDGTRRDAAFRQHQNDWYIEHLGAAQRPFDELAGSRRTRRLAALAYLGAVPTQTKSMPA